MNSHIIDVTQTTFQEAVIDASHQHPILVDFWATWCNPCKLLIPILSKLAEEYSGQFILAKINTEQERSLAEKHAIRSIPSVMLFKNGEIVDSFSGMLPENEIRLFLDNHLPCAADTLLLEAQHAYQSGNANQGLTLTKQALSHANNKLRIIAKSCQLLIDHGDYPQAKETLEKLPIDKQMDTMITPLMARLGFIELLENIPDKETARKCVENNPDDLTNQYALGLHLALAGQYPEAMESLLTVIKKNPKFEQGIARKAMLKVFEALGNSGELVHKYRIQMAKYLL